ncbi:MAG: hypothetical protein COV48_00945 [Elusimicrobia bacterium CG11_big_fil_rev_8_21_14_0_20_64_6]|nr:MAG: hypothetical protein COV48_00945 [Elusimicrobia bacterium CG11_big_fil_rev_8_21_14_0_20_64_6]
MKAFLCVLALSCAAPALAGPAGRVDAHAASATGYPGAYLGTVSLSLAADPLYGSRLLDAFDLHLRSVAAMTSPRAVADYLEIAVVGAGVSSARAVKESLGREAMDPRRASALLLAHALARPKQFREVLEGLEARRAGLGKHTSRLLREIQGRGDRELLATLRARGEVSSDGYALTYNRFGQLDNLFDGGGFRNADAVELSGPVSVPADYTGYGPDGLPRRSGLMPPRE